MNDEVRIYDNDDVRICDNVEEALEVLRKYSTTSPDCCGDCYFMVKPSTFGALNMMPFHGYCKLETEFDLDANWRIVVTDDVGCTSLTFLKKLLEIM